MFHNKVAVITGAASGIGEATALKMSELGAKIVIVDLNNERSLQVKEKILQAGRECIFVDTDVADDRRVANAIKETINTFGQIDIVFANAGINGNVNNKFKKYISSDKICCPPLEESWW